MILLFGDKATKSNTSAKTNSVKNNNPVENAGILAMNFSNAKSLLTVGEYDTYVSNNPVAIDYSMYSTSDFSDTNSGFMSDFSSAVATLGDCGFSAGGFDCGGASSCSSGSSCSSFASVC